MRQYNEAGGCSSGGNEPRHPCSSADNLQQLSNKNTPKRDRYLRFNHISPPPRCFRVLALSRRRAPNEPGQFCSLFVLGGAMKYLASVPPRDQAGGGGFVSAPRPCPPSTRHHLQLSSYGMGGGLGNLRSLRTLCPIFCSPTPRVSSFFLLLLLSRHAIPPISLLDSAIYVWLFPAGEGVGYSSMWTLSIHDQWRGPALYTKPSRRAGLFYSQPCGFKQIARTGELKQILSCRFQDMQRKQVGINYV